MTLSSAPKSNRLSSLTTRRTAVIALFILLFATAVRIPLDTDTWWHLRSGEWILSHREIPRTDPFSFTRENQPWIDHSWGSQVILYGVYKLFGGTGQPGDGGNVGLAFYTALLATGGMLFVYLMCEGNAYTRGLVVLLAAATAAVFWSARPQMISFFLSAVTLYLCFLYKRKHIDRLWLIPVLMIVWVNLHGGYAIGFIILFGVIAGETLGRLFDSANPDVLTWRQIGKLCLITVIAALALVINPNTTQMWGYPFRTFGIGVLQQFIQEWASPDFHRHETWPFIFLLLGTFAAVGLSKKRLDWTDLVLVSGIAFMSLYSGRNIATFAIVAAPVLSRHLNTWLEERGWRLARPRPARGMALALNIVLLVVISLGAIAKIAYALNPIMVATAQIDALPVDAARFLNTIQPDGKMFNSYNWGGYLMFAVPQYPVFVDGRTDLFDDQLLSQWLETEQGHNWQTTFQQFNIHLTVIEHDSGLAEALRRVMPIWQEIYQDKQASIFQCKQNQCW